MPKKTATKKTPSKKSTQVKKLNFSLTRTNQELEEQGYSATYVPNGVVLTIAEPLVKAMALAVTGKGAVVLIIKERPDH